MSVTVPAVSWQRFTRESGGQMIRPLPLEWSWCSGDSQLGRPRVWRQIGKQLDNRSSRGSSLRTLCRLLTQAWVNAVMGRNALPWVALGHLLVSERRFQRTRLRILFFKQNSLWAVVWAISWVFLFGHQVMCQGPLARFLRWLHWVATWWGFSGGATGPRLVPAFEISAWVISSY